VTVLFKCFALFDSLLCSSLGQPWKVSAPTAATKAVPLSTAAGITLYQLDVVIFCSQPRSATFSCCKLHKPAVSWHKMLSGTITCHLPLSAASICCHSMSAASRQHHQRSGTVYCTCFLWTTAISCQCDISTSASSVCQDPGSWQHLCPFLC
jgi:hypothetical protein